MPYRHAHWWVMIVLVVIFVGFWPSYWSIPREVHWEHHLHGVVATIWVVMVIAQSWSAHHKRLPVHRATGQASLYLFPLLIAGLFGVQAVNAKVYASGEGFLVATYGPAFLFGLSVAVAAYVTLYYRALKYRRKVWVHSGYLLGTPIILFESPAGRLLNNHLPPLRIEGPQDIPLAMQGILWSDALMLAVCLLAWWRSRHKSNAFLVVGGFVALQMVVMGGLYYGGGGEAAVRAVATIPTPAMIACGLMLGAATSWLGWQAGKGPSKVPVGAIAA